MERGDIVQVRIEDMSSEGQGIGRADGLVIFVPYTVVGDVARVRLTKVKKRFAFSSLEEIVEPSEYRTDEELCAGIHEGCGGCSFSPMRYEAQLLVKEKQIREKLRRLAGIEDPPVAPIIGMRADDNDGMGCCHYRNKAGFPVSTGGIITLKGGIVKNLGEPAVGFYRGKSHEVIDAGECLLQSPAAMAAASALRQFMAEDNITGWDPKWEKGLMKQLIVKTGFNTGEVMAILTINGKGIPNLQKLVQMMDDAVYEAEYSLESVVLRDLKGNDKPVAGSNVIHDRIGDLTFEISAASFYQVNPVQAERLYDKVREYCAFSDVKPVILDLYCGVGTIGLYCADRAAEVIGIEVVKEAVLDANRNAVINGIVNARYICDKAEDVLPIQAEQEPVKRASIAILDPPRAGCRPKLLETVADLGIERIVYVSCDPATLARDIKLLGDRGYALREVSPVDMFPHTAEVEAAALLVKES